MNKWLMDAEIGAKVLGIVNDYHAAIHERDAAAARERIGGAMRELLTDAVLRVLDQPFEVTESVVKTFMPELPENQTDAETPAARAAREITTRGEMTFDRIDIEFIAARPWMVFYSDGVEIARKAFEQSYSPGHTLQIEGIRGSTGVSK